MTDLRVIIVDDEAMARSALRRMLGEFPGVCICGETDSVNGAEQLVRKHGIDVVYLDIELYGESGFDLVDRLDETIAVVFVTAYSHYAPRAFDVDARDYLLKPVTKARLAENIQRLRKLRGLPDPSFEPVNLNLDDDILVKQGKTQIRRPLKQLSRIEVSGDFTVLTFTDGASGTVWQSLSRWEEKLPEAHFVRIHRGMIVNLDQVDTFETMPGSRLKLHMKGTHPPCLVSRRQTPGLKKRLL